MDVSDLQLGQKLFFCHEWYSLKHIVESDVQSIFFVVRSSVLYPRFLCFNPSPFSCLSTSLSALFIKREEYPIQFHYMKISRELFRSEKQPPMPSPKPLLRLNTSTTRHGRPRQKSNHVCLEEKPTLAAATFDKFTTSNKSKAKAKV